MSDSSQAYVGAPRDAARTLADGRNAVLALSSGGCARYLFSTDVAYVLDRKGIPLLTYESPNPHHHLIMANSTLSLRVPGPRGGDGLEESHLVLVGLLRMVDPGDHDAIDRYGRYYDLPVDNQRSGHCRLYRLMAERIEWELISGERIPLPVDEVVLPNPLTAAQERLLLETLASHPRVLHRLYRTATGRRGAGETLRAAGLDGGGADLRAEDRIERCRFKTRARTAAQVARQLLPRTARPATF